VELGELANETRCFKYWSCKGPSDKKDILDEYADCILMILMFCNYLDVSLDENFEEPIETDIIEQFTYLYYLCSQITNNYNKEYIKNILSNFIYLGKLLNFTDNDIINGCLNKINKNIVRLSEDFIN
jgi:dimeric dUTPase (all-alpha-NTP-PPase superfamily)